jgi:hypothetical protein
VAPCGCRGDRQVAHRMTDVYDRRQTPNDRRPLPPARTAPVRCVVPAGRHGAWRRRATRQPTDHIVVSVAKEDEARQQNWRAQAGEAEEDDRWDACRPATKPPRDGPRRDGQRQ